MRTLTSLLLAVALVAQQPKAALRLIAALSMPAMVERTPQAEPLVIVVNRSNPVDNVSSAELRRIFLGNRSYWPNGRRITLVMRDPGEPERITILREVCGMTDEQLKHHYLHGLFTGEILVSPKILSTPTGVRKFVFNVPGAIGYLRISDIDNTVKVLKIDDLSPEDKAYRLHLQNPGGEPGE